MVNNKIEPSTKVRYCPVPRIMKSITATNATPNTGPANVPTPPRNNPTKKIKPLFKSPMSATA